MSKRHDEKLLHATRVEIQEQIQRMEDRLGDPICERRTRELYAAIDCLNKILAGEEVFCG